MGADRDKVIMGIPFYGQSYTLETNNQNDVGAPAFGPGNPGEFTQQPGMLAYYEICERSTNFKLWICFVLIVFLTVRSKNWKVSRDKFGAHGPYAYSGDQWVGYEDVDSIKEKVKNYSFNY